MARKTGHRPLKQPEITIIGEGLTERCYFTTLRRLKGYEYDCKPRNFTEQDYNAMQRLIDLTLANGGIAVCVFDEDVAREKPAEAKKLAAMRSRYKNNQHVLLCGSMPSIEFWFLLHYLRTNRYFATSHDVIAALRTYIPGFDKHERFLAREQWVSSMVAEGRMRAACERAKAMPEDSESYSDVWKLFELL